MADMTSGGVQPVYNVGGNDNDGLFDGNGMIIFFLFFLLAWGGFGNGGFGGNGGTAAAAQSYATQQDLVNGFNFNSLDNGVQDIQKSICQLGYNNLEQSNGINTNMLQATNAINSNILGQTNDLNMAIAQQGSNIAMGMAQLGYNTQSQGCAINNNIDNVKYDIASQTCAITTNSTANTQRILDKLCQLEMSDKDNQIANLELQLQAANLQNNNATQTAALISALRPFPTPAYPVSSPYASSSSCGCGLG